MTCFTKRTITSGTTIVAIRTPDEIIVGADSRIASVGDTPAVTGIACKIRQIDNMFFAHARLIQDTRGTFNVPATVIQARQNSRSILDTANRFEKMIAGPLSNGLEEISQAHPLFYQRSLEGKSTLDIVFFGVEKGTPLLYLRYFVATRSRSGSISVNVQRLDCPGDCPTGMTYAFLGHHAAIDRFLDDNLHYSRIGWEPTVRKLIELEIEENPDEVGYPIDILHIDMDRARWIQRKEHCPEIREYW